MDCVAHPILVASYSGRGSNNKREIEQYLTRLRPRLHTDIHMRLANEAAVTKMETMFDLKQHVEFSGGEILMGKNIVDFGDGCYQFGTNRFEIIQCHEVILLIAKT